MFLFPQYREPDGYTGSATIFLSVPRAFVFGEDYVLPDITVVLFREVTDTAAVASPYEETLRLTEVLRKKPGSEISLGVESEITAIGNALKKIQDAADETARLIRKQPADSPRGCLLSSKNITRTASLTPGL